MNKKLKKWFWLTPLCISGLITPLIITACNKQPIVFAPAQENKLVVQSAIKYIKNNHRITTQSEPNTSVVFYEMITNNNEPVYVYNRKLEPKKNDDVQGIDFSDEKGNWIDVITEPDKVSLIYSYQDFENRFINTNLYDPNQDDYDEDWNGKHSKIKRRMKSIDFNQHYLVIINKVMYSQPFASTSFDLEGLNIAEYKVENKKLSIVLENTQIGFLDHYTAPIPGDFYQTKTFFILLKKDQLISGISLYLEDFSEISNPYFKKSSNY